MQKNFKSQQRSSNLEPMFKPIHSKTMSLVGMLKQYATSGHASNEATERAFSSLKREKQPEIENERQTRRRSDGLTGGQ